MANDSRKEQTQAQMRGILKWRGEKWVEKRRHLQIIDTFATSSQLVSQTRHMNHVTPIGQLETLSNVGSLENTLAWWRHLWGGRRTKCYYGEGLVVFARSNVDMCYL